MVEMSTVDGRTCRLMLVLVITASYFLVEISVGYLTNSVALIADSFHMLSDVFALIIGLVAIRFGQRPSSKYYTFGYKRAEVLGALVNGVFLLALCFTIVIEALERFVSPEQVSNPKLLLIVGSIGFGLNLLSMMIMCKYSDMHMHFHSESQSNQEAEGEPLSHDHGHQHKEHHHNMKAVFLHVLGDALGSVGVIISASIIWLVQADWTKYVDPTISLMIVFILLTSTVPMVLQVVRILLDSAPKNLNVVDLRKQILQIDGVTAVHELHIWELQSNVVVATVHVHMQCMDVYDRAATQIKHIFHSHNIHSTTVQPEFNYQDSQPQNECTTSCALPCSTAHACLAKRCCDDRDSPKQYGSLNSNSDTQ